MSDQGDAGQWRPASRHNGENSAPDDTTGPLPAVSGDEAAAPGFPPMGGTSSTWSADDDEAPAGGFPSVSPPVEAQSAPSSERAPFEPADPLPAPRSYDSTTPLSDEAWSSYGRSAEERSFEAADLPSFEAADLPSFEVTDPPSSAGQEPESSGSTPPFGVEMPDVKPYEPGESFPAYGTPGEQPEESSYGYGTSGEKPFGFEESSFGSGSWGEKSYEPGESSFGSDVPGEKSFGSEESSFGRRPGESFAHDHRVTAEEQAAENEFFAPDDHPPMWDKVVAPAGPPPQPGKPSSGNLRLPEWMRDEAAGGGEHTGSDGEEEGRSKRPLYIGVGLLVAGLVAVAGVYLLKGGDSQSASRAAAAPAQPSQGPTQPSAEPGSAKPQPEKALTQFKGDHTKPAGRIIDQRSGLSYPRLGKPWELPPKKSPMTELGFSASQFAVTEKAGGQPRRWARLMSAELGGAEKDAYTGPGTERDAATRVAAAYEARMYGFRHRKKLLASQPLDVDGHKGWLVGYYLTYHRPGVKANGDIVTVALVDTGRKTPGVLFMSVPNTHRKLWPDVNYVVHSIKVA